MVQVMFESDSLSAISGINDSLVNVEGDARFSIEAIREMAFHRPLWNFFKISRQANQNADYLAKWAAVNLVFGCIPLDFLPICILRQNWVFNPP